MTLQRATLVASTALAKAQSVEGRLNALIGTSQNPNTATVLYTPSSTVITASTPGFYSWTCPAGVTQAKVECWGAGSGGGGGNQTKGGEGGGGGEYGQWANYPLTPGRTYYYFVGSGGTGGFSTAAGIPGGISFFDLPGSFGGVFAAPGNPGSAFTGGSGGSGGGNSIDFAGGSGGGNAFQSTGGCGGGGSAGSTGAGGSGTSSASGTGTAGGAAGAGGGAAGGAGGNAGASGSNGIAPGGGGGGAGAETPTGEVILNYTFPNAASYYGTDAVGGNANQQRVVNSTLYQGGQTAGGENYYGTQKSLLTLPSSVQSDLSGVTIDSVTLTIDNEYTQQGPGMEVVLGYTSQSSLPGTWNGGGITSVSNFYILNQEILVQDLTATGLGAALKSGSAKSLSLGPGSAYTPVSHGDFWGVSGGGAPSLTIRGYTGTAPAKGGNGANGQVMITYSAPSAVVASVQPAAVTDPVSAITIPAGAYVGPGTGVTLAGGTPPTVTPGTAVMYGTTGGSVGIAGTGGLTSAGAISATGVGGGYAEIAASQTTGDPYLIMYPPNTVHLQNPPQIIVSTGNQGLTNEYYAMELYSGDPAGSGTPATVTLYSGNNDGSSNPSVSFTANFVVNGASNFNNSCTFNEGFTVFGTVDLSGASTVKGGWSLAQSISFSEGFAVTGGTIALASGQQITGTPNFNNAVTVSAPAGMSTTVLNADTANFTTGGVNFEEGFTVNAGTVNLGGSVTGFTVGSGTGTTTFNDNVTFTSAANFSAASLVWPSGYFNACAFDGQVQWSNVLSKPSFAGVATGGTLNGDLITGVIPQSAVPNIPMSRVTGAGGQMSVQNAPAHATTTDVTATVNSLIDALVNANVLN